MQISELLGAKQSSAPKEVVSCEESNKVIEAIRLMSEHNIGAVVITRGEEIVGVYSERDVVNNCNERDADFRDQALSELMSSNVIDVRPDQTIDDALLLMRDNSIRHLPVVDNKKMVGFLSLRDLMIAKLDHADRKAEFLTDQMHVMNKPLPM